MTVPARAYAAGDAEGPALVLRQPLSLWGGIDLHTGRIIDQAHPDAGAGLNSTDSSRRGEPLDEVAFPLAVVSHPRTP